MPSLPAQIPVIHFASPAFGDRTLTELWNTEVASYIELPYGSRHPNEEKWQDYLLVKQEPLQGDEKWVMRTWMQDPVIENTYNLAKQEFDGEKVDKPTFIRTYLVRRTAYDANIPAKGSKLTGVIGVRMTNGGSGYDSTTTVTLTTVSAGSGATAEAIIFRGEIVGVRIASEGINYDVAPTVSFTGPAGSAGATAIARIQPVSAVLTRESVERIESEPDDGLYLKVTRVYETLPGSILTSTKMGEQGATETTTVTRVASGSVSVAGGYLVQDDVVKAESTVVDVHSRTTIAAWPTMTDYDQHPEHRGSIVTTFHVVDASGVSAPSSVAGKITRYKHIDQFRSMQIIEDYTAFTSITYSEQRFMAYNFPRLLNVTSGFAWTDACGLFADIRDAFSALVNARLDVSFTTTVQSISGLTIIPKSLHLGHGLQESNVLVDACAACLTYSGTCSGTVTFGASSPSRTTYLTYVAGSAQLVSGESARTQYGGIYKNSSLYVQMV